MNIYIVGAGGSGKTTLCEALQRHYIELRDRTAHSQQPKHISELARSVIADLGISRDDIRSSPEKCLQLQKAILEAQHQAELKLEQEGPQWYISDRSGMDAVVMTYLYVGEEEARKLLALPAWQYLEQKMQNGLVFLCQSTSKWILDDGTRLLPNDEDEWERIDQVFAQLLTARGIHFILIPRDMTELSERTRFVLDAHNAVDKRLAASNTISATSANDKTRSDSRLDQLHDRRRSCPQNWSHQ